MFYQEQTGYSKATIVRRRYGLMTDWQYNPQTMKEWSSTAPEMGTKKTTKTTTVASQLSIITIVWYQ